MSKDLVLEKEYLFLSDGYMKNGLGSPYLLPKIGIGKASLKYIHVLIKQSTKADVNKSHEDDEDHEDHKSEDGDNVQYESENQIKKSIDQMCGKPDKKNIEFYSGDDMTLGEFLRNTASVALEKCEHCDKKKYQHVQDIYHGEGYIEISVSIKGNRYFYHKLEDKEFDKNSKTKENNYNRIRDLISIDASDAIMMYEECKKCKSYVKEKKTINSDLQEYSFTKFLEQYFCNPDIVAHHSEEVLQEMANNDLSSSSDGSSHHSQSNCEHRVHRDMIRTFIIGNIKIKMKYKKIDIYSIDIVKFRDIDNSEYLDKISREEFDLIKDNFPCCIKDVHEEFQRVKSILLKILKYPEVVMNFSEFYQETLNLICRNENDLETFEKDAFTVIEWYASKKQSDKNDIFELILLRKKLFIQLFNYVCILYKAKRLLRHIYEAHTKLETKEARGLKIPKPKKLEYAASVAKNQEKDDLLKPGLEPMRKHESVNEVLQPRSLSKGSESEEHKEPATAEIHLDVSDLTDLVHEKRPRKSSIEVITEEKEDLLEPSDNDESKTEIKDEIASEHQGIPEGDKIIISDMDSCNNVANTENAGTPENLIEDDEEEEDQDDMFDELLNILQDNEATFLENENFSNLKDGLISLECGINSVCIPIHRDDIGSIIAYSLSTNYYYEGLARQNYMEFQSKIDQNSGEEMDMTNKLNTNPKNTVGGPKDYVEKRGQSAGSLHGLQNQLHHVKHTDSTKKKEQILLNDRTDVLDSEYQPHHIESEFLSYEKINFKLKFSTSKKDAKLRVFKNIFIVDNIHGSSHGNIQEYCHKDKNLDEKVLKNYSKNFLDDDNIVKSYCELKDIKDTLEMRKSTLKHKSKRQTAENLSIDLTNMNYNVPASSPRAVKKPSGESDNNVSRINMAPIPDLSFVPDQPPVHHLTDKYKENKVFTNLGIEDLDFEVTIYFPKKFEALRKFYCGSHEDFIKSIMRTNDWADNTGGRTNSRFFKSGDEKYIFKEIKPADIRMFTEFAPRYFDYLCKSFFHNFPCAIAKILGAYKISIRKNGNKNREKERYFVITENLNYGVVDGPNIIRYDLKGSCNNRYIRTDDGQGRDMIATKGQVLQDTNFRIDTQSRPMVLKNVYYKILMICINNDSLFFSRSNIVDYSLLVVIDKEKKTVRFGIIDYIQQYTMEKMVESKFKTMITSHDKPTIIEANPYKDRFQEAIRKYFIGL